MLTVPAKSQDTNNFKEQFTNHFNYASRVLALAKEMPSETYDWRPMEDAYTVAKVYTHIARYNYLYLVNNLGATLPEGVNLENMESITDKDQVISVLEASIEFVNETVDAMPESRLTEATELYGRTVNGQEVLFQLVTHLSEHTGQAISYARMNEVVPPWNR